MQYTREAQDDRLRTAMKNVLETDEPIVILGFQAAEKPQRSEY